MTALERNIPLTEITRSATAAATAADSGTPATCPYPRGSAAAWAWCHVFSAALAQLTLEMEAAC
jgi:hypothetical protein